MAAHRVARSLCPVSAARVSSAGDAVRLERLRDDILAVRWRRASARAPAPLATQVEQLADLERASAQHRRAVVVESLEAFAQELAAARLGPG